MVDLDYAVLDFETFYDKDFSLSKMQTDAYVVDPRFQIIGVGASAARGKELEWFSGPEKQVKEFLQDSIRWEKTPVCCHNTLFDGFISTKRLGLKPKMWMDTLGMARMAWPFLPKHGLAHLAEYLGIGQKGTEVVNAMGKRLEDFTPEDLARYGEYCKNDAALTRVLADHLLGLTPVQELVYIDMVIRMFTEPRLYGDAMKLMAYHAREIERKEDLMATAGIGKDEIMSNNKFAAALEGLGAVPPKKISPATGKETFAFSKTDKAFKDMLDDPDPRVQALVAARLGVKSTIAETRALRLVEAAGRGPLPVYLNFWGAKVTGRLSGGNNMNWQNVPARGPGAEIREAIVAPEGHSVVVGDSSNIELRVAMALAGQQDVLDQLASGVDLYCAFASKLFGRPITKDDKKERMLGKIAMLSLQYGAGAAKFIEMVRIQVGMTLSLTEGERIVSLYREVHAKIQALWWYLGREVLQAIAQGRLLVSVDVNGWFLTTHNGFALPGHAGVCYHDLKKDQLGEWSYSTGRERVKIYGGKVLENMSQHAARHIVMWQTARVHQRFPVSLSVHDEIVCVVRNDEVAACVAHMNESLSLAPKWCRGTIPLTCEVGVGQSYYDAK